MSIIVFWKVDKGCGEEYVKSGIKQRNSCKFLSLLVITSLFCITACNTRNSVESSVSELDPITQISVVTEGTTGTTIDVGEYDYEIFLDQEKSLAIRLPINLDDYIIESENGSKEYLLRKLLSDFGWKEMDWDEDGDFSLPVCESGFFSYDVLQKEGDFFYYDCGDMWIRLSIHNQLHSDPLIFSPLWLDYSFIYPNNPGDYYYSFTMYSSDSTNNVDARMNVSDLPKQVLSSTDIEHTFLYYDYFVLLAYVATWPSILPEENPLFYLNYGELYTVDDVRKNILRDEYSFR